MCVCVCVRVRACACVRACVCDESVCHGMSCARHSLKISLCVFINSFCGGFLAVTCTIKKSPAAIIRNAKIWNIILLLAFFQI